ncbi:MAG: NAD-dependent epimerase/dehydratase family protein [Bacteroidetes bacterium]|nr:MAG: NAD-dependent epimerase/dehydratase family protein [Bacteroidota bacterium]MBL1144850.1 NAD-dependent epimerase/dehydratase family protein [Bacteroidota bacterium]NOG57644.1 NAD-dependent epimerase/dehydratase family protein [Bacteroidota bacterium]
MILVIGAGGQVGQELVFNLREIYGNDKVVASDLRELQDQSGPFEVLNALDKNRLHEIVAKYKIKEVYHLAALLSATAEKQPKFGWELNMDSLFYVLDLAKDKIIDKIFWPSSIAVFGPNTPRDNTPQHTVTDPTTVYGISKLAGERWCEYYAKNYGVDVRSIRYPGLIGYKTLPGGGTTDYAVDIYHQALAEGKYECFLKENAYLPMMYMEDAIRATIELMQSDSDKISIRSSYNLGGISFSPKEIAAAIKKEIPSFTISYNPDFRQKIAESWPSSIDDSQAQKDWNWKMKYDLDNMTIDMLSQLKKMKAL